MGELFYSPVQATTHWIYPDLEVRLRPEDGNVVDTAPTGFRRTSARRGTTQAVYMAEYGFLNKDALQDAGFIIGGYVAVTYGWRQAFLIIGVPGLVVALVIALTLREPARGFADGLVAFAAELTAKRTQNLVSDSYIPPVADNG